MADEVPEKKEIEAAPDPNLKYIMLGHEYHVCSWRPGPPRSGPCTEVHLSWEVAPGMRAVVRLKSARALDALVGVLLDYRKEVWPDAGRNNG